MGALTNNLQSDLHEIMRQLPRGVVATARREQDEKDERRVAHPESSPCGRTAMDEKERARAAPPAAADADAVA
eukprot:gene30942-9219_t